MRLLAIVLAAAAVGLVSGLLIAGSGHSPTRRTAILKRPSMQEVRDEEEALAIAELESRVQRLTGCMPELTDYINSLTNGLDASRTLSAACVPLFYPEGLPKN